MPTKPKHSSKSKAPESECLTLAVSDEDDFQNPNEAISLAQSIILSSLQKPNKSSSSQTLKPSNRTRPLKKPKRAAATGKENCGNFGSQSFGTGTAKGYGEKKMFKMKSGYFSNSIEPRLLERRVDSDSVLCNSGLEEENFDPEHAVATGKENCELFESQSFDIGTAKGHDEEKGFKMNSGYLLNSIESRLLDRRVDSDSVVCNNGLEEDSYEDFEPGTQLNVLISLCEVENSNGVEFSVGNDLGALDFEVGRNFPVECPVCGTDISDLVEELRLVHTNDCLDKDEIERVMVPSDSMHPNSPRQIVDVTPVVAWLRSLGLSRFEEAFVREEVDWETLQWLTEEDLLSLGVTALGPRKKIVHALNELKKRNIHGHDTSTVMMDENKKQPIPGNKLITEFFPGSGATGRADSAAGTNRVVERRNTTSTSRDLAATRTQRAVERRNSTSTSTRPAAKNYVNNRRIRDIPPWCSIPGTTFRVDAFRYLRGDCSHWFLTHFHMDHYQGLTRGFCHGKIYCSAITARLVNMKIGVPWDRLQVLPLNQKVSIAGISVTCIDANHCPGSIIILFEPPNNKAVLHTGDFRFREDMANIPLLQSCHIHTLILDTTYCDPQYDFPKQEAVIQFVIEAIQAEAFNPKTLFLIGSYTIGKERLFLEVARFLRKKVYVGAAKLRLLECLGLPEEDMQWLTVNEQESQIHVVPMWTIASFKRMKHISDRYSSRFDLIVAFSPTGWTFGKGKKNSPGRRWKQGTIIRYEVPYSEHCSFMELRDFVQLLSPENIIPSVNNSGSESADAMIAQLMSNS